MSVSQRILQQVSEHPRLILFVDAVFAVLIMLTSRQGPNVFIVVTAIALLFHVGLLGVIWFAFLRQGRSADEGE